MEEIWKDIKGFEGLYQISSLGRLKSLSRFINSNRNNQRRIKGCIIKQRVNPYNGYIQISLSKNHKYKRFYIHRLVAYAFLRNPDNLPQVNHKDENKENNCVDNLEWCTAKYNANYGTCISRRVKTQRDTKSHINNEALSRKVKCIDTGKIYLSAQEVSRQTGLDNSSISKCCRGVYKKCGGFRWCYL